MPINEAPQYNKQHAVPQNIMDVEFKIIGELTLRQFAYLIVFGGIAYISAVYVNGLFKWPLTVLMGSLGFGLAFVPLQERGLDQWIVNFFMAVYTPCQKVWRKDPITPAVFLYQNMAVVKQELVTLAPTSSRRKLEEFLERQDMKQNQDRLDIPETHYIQMAKEAFANSTSRGGKPKSYTDQPIIQPAGESQLFGLGRADFEPAPQQPATPEPSQPAEPSPMPTSEVTKPVEPLISSTFKEPVVPVKEEVKPMPVEESIPTPPVMPTPPATPVVMNEPKAMPKFSPAPLIGKMAQVFKSTASVSAPTPEPKPDIQPELKKREEPVKEPVVEIKQEPAVPAPPPPPQVEKAPSIPPVISQQRPYGQPIPVVPSSKPVQPEQTSTIQPPKSAEPIQPKPVTEAPPAPVVPQPETPKPVETPISVQQPPTPVVPQEAQQPVAPPPPPQPAVPQEPVPQRSSEIITRISTPAPAPNAPAEPAFGSQIIKRRRLYQPHTPSQNVYVSSPMTPDRHSGRRFTSLLPKEGEIILPIRGERVLKTSEELNVEESLKNKTEQLNKLIDQIKQSKEFKKISVPHKPAPPPEPIKPEPKPVEPEKPKEPEIPQEELEKQKVIEEIKVLREKVLSVRRNKEEEAQQRAREIYEATQKQAVAPTYHEEAQPKETVPGEPVKVEDQRVVVPDMPNIISGFIRDQFGKGLVGVVVIVKNNSGKSVRAVKTNSIGQFTMATPLASGQYTLEIDTSHRTGYSFDIISTEVKGEIVPPLEIKGRKS